MRYLLRISILLSLLCVGALESLAFSLLGPTPTWQTTAIGYVDQALFNDVNGGPMNLGEGYRWNIPTIFYSYSPDFLHYFGKEGADEIDKAIKVLNDLPSMDSINVADYPLESQRVNYRASALALYDLKSVALSWLVHDLGLTDPTRNVFTARNRYIVGTVTNYTIIRRNFDPITFEPTSFINGQLWTYTTIIDPATAAGEIIVLNQPVDPLALGGSINAPVASDLANFNLLLGGFWTGLTRDDVGGLRYLYRSSNLNVETPPPGSSRFLAGSGALSSGSSGSSSGGSPWSLPPRGTVGTTTGTGTTTLTNIIGNALRPGVGKVNFVRINYDSLFGQYPSNNVSYVDRVITNGNQITQPLVRQLLAPDLLFDAQDLQQGDGTTGFFREASVLTFQNNDALNGLTGTDGPGQINPGGTAAPAVVVAFTKTGPAFGNQTASFLSEVNSFQHFVWGSFDGSTNAPVVYPSGTSLAEVEAQALGGRSSSGGSFSSQVDAWAPAATVLLPVGTVAAGTGTGTGTGTTP